MPGLSLANISATAPFDSPGFLRFCLIAYSMNFRLTDVVDRFAALFLAAIFEVMRFNLFAPPGSLMRASMERQKKCANSSESTKARKPISSSENLKSRPDSTSCSDSINSDVMHLASSSQNSMNFPENGLGGFL